MYSKFPKEKAARKRRVVYRYAYQQKNIPRVCVCERERIIAQSFQIARCKRQQYVINTSIDVILRRQKNEFVFSLNVTPLPRNSPVPNETSYSQRNRLFRTNERIQIHVNTLSAPTANKYLLFPRYLFLGARARPDVGARSESLNDKSGTRPSATKYNGARCGSTRGQKKKRKKRNER